MKTLTTLILLASAAFGFAADNHSHEKKAGPHGGKLLEADNAHIEFFVQTDKKAEVFVYDENMKPVPTGEGQLVVTAGTREKQEKLAVEKKDASFVTAALPAGTGYWVILQWKPTPDAAAKTLRVKYVEGICSGCNLPEYACTCDHAH